MMYKTEHEDLKKYLDSLDNDDYHEDANEVINYVNQRFFKDIEKATLWLNTNNPALGYISPLDMIKMYRKDKLMSWIKTQLLENEK